MSRSTWKEPFSLLHRGPFFNLYQKNPLAFLYQKQENTINNTNTIEVWSRNLMILPEHIGKDAKIYNGKNWTFRKVVEEMVGHKFGEFCPTKRKTTHKINKVKQVTRNK